MKQPKEYSAKEISIFEGIVVLLNEGLKLHELKVADIAAAAGMGKSTAYEYFSSKEDIIREAVRYHVSREFGVFSDFVSSQDSFAGMIEISMDYIIDMLQTRFFSLLMMVLNLNQSELKHLIYEDNDMLTSVQSGINEQIEKILSVGKKEKLIGEAVTTDDCRLVLSGMLSAFSNEAKNKIFYQRQSPEGAETAQFAESLKKLKERTLNLVLKALN